MTLHAVYGLKLIVIYQHWLINYNKCCNCTNARMLKIGEPRGREGIWAPYVFFSFFSIKLNYSKNKFP